jgi:hypothetical protein
VIEIMSDRVRSNHGLACLTVGDGAERDVRIVEGLA